MGLSVIEPVSIAIEQTKEILFRPFELGKWLRLGFCAFLMGLTSSGGGGGGGGPGQPRAGGGNPPGGDPFFEWIKDHLLIVFAIAVVVVAMIIIVWFVITWLSSRGHFMFIDGVVQNRGAVVEPWREYRYEGNSLFWLRFWLSWASLTALLAIALFAGALALPDILEDEFGLWAMSAIVFAAVSMVAFVLLSALVSMVLADFVVPIMYLRRTSSVKALQAWHQEMLLGHFAAFVRYALFKILMSICVGVIALFVVCGTCCLALIPYIGTVILLPVYVFYRCYSLYFIEQFGPEWTIFPLEELSPIE